MSKPLMPYGSSQHSSLIVKGGGKNQLAERQGAQLASSALSNTGGYLARGGMGKVVVGSVASRLVRINAGAN